MPGRFVGRNRIHGLERKINRIKANQNGGGHLRRLDMRKSAVILVFVFFIFISLAYGAESDKQKVIADSVIWVVENAEKGQVIKLTGDGKTVLSRKGGFSYAKDITVDSRDGSIWVVDTGNNQIIKLSSDAKTELARISGFALPYHGSIDPNDSSYWVADQNHFEVVKLSSEGKEQLRITGFTLPHEVEVSPYDGSVWVMDSMGGKIIKMSPEGEILGQLEGFGFLMHIAISPFDGACWVLQNRHTNKEGVNALIKISSDCKEVLVNNTDVARLNHLSINPIDGSCWLVDKENRKLYNIAQDGKTLIFSLDTVSQPLSISKVDPLDGSFWVGYKETGEIVKISAMADVLARVSGFKIPFAIVVSGLKE